MALENAALELRSVTRLLVDDDGRPARYWIPAYQRGYRWTRLEVTQLLDDFWDFFCEEKPKTAFYCLQPLVVRRLDDGSYEIVDGQQRLTTILILFRHCEDIIKIFRKQTFSIDYETRDSTFLASVDFDRSNENVDFYHICEARKAIEDWLNARDSSHKLSKSQMNGRHAELFTYCLYQDLENRPEFRSLCIEYEETNSTEEPGIIISGGFRWHEFKFFVHFQAETESYVLRLREPKEFTAEFLLFLKNKAFEEIDGCWTNVLDRAEMNTEVKALCGALEEAAAKP